MSRRRVFAPTPGVRYAVEVLGIRLLDTRRGATCWLGYPEAAVWDMAVRGCDLERIVADLQNIAGMTAAHGEQVVSDLFATLQSLGFVSEVADGQELGP